MSFLFRIKYNMMKYDGRIEESVCGLRNRPNYSGIGQCLLNPHEDLPSLVAVFFEGMRENILHIFRALDG